MLNLDTHILIWLLVGRLELAEESLIRESSLCISSIVLWELAKLNQLGRIELDLESESFRRLLARLRVIPIDPQVALASTRLDFRSDPADELIAATSFVHGIPLLTRDGKLRASKLVPLAI